MYQKLIEYPDKDPKPWWSLPLGALMFAGLYACQDKPDVETNPWSDPDFVREEFKKLSDDYPNYFSFIREVTEDFVSKVDPVLLNDIDFIFSLLSIDFRFHYKSDNAELVKALIKNNINHAPLFIGDKLSADDEFLIFASSFGFVIRPVVIGNTTNYVWTHESDYNPPIISGLSEDNPVHELFAIESDLRSTKEIEKAKQILNDLLCTMARRLALTEIKNFGIKYSINTQVQRAYDILEELGYTYKGNSVITLTEALKNKQLDCDTSAWIILALAAELKSFNPEWSKLGIICLPQHAFLSYKELYFDQGYDYMPKEYYLQKWSIPESKSADILKPLYGTEAFQVTAKLTFYYEAGNH
ncbi:MAG: hypothetical protein LBL50_04970 [Candidatus Margulisbacteria bacterium]|jgi:hypothetical protein|nr:hypothetical protein [Candidatus Margulisiibacteriota bacterium]